MPTQQEVFDSIVSSVRSGAENAGGTLDASGVDALKSRYYDWIVKPGKDKDGKDTKTPQEVWNAPAGAALSGKFHEIGKLAALGAPGNKAEDTHTDNAATKVQGDSMCDWC